MKSLQEIDFNFILILDLFIISKLKNTESSFDFLEDKVVISIYKPEHCNIKSSTSFILIFFQCSSSNCEIAVLSFKSLGIDCEGALIEKFLMISLVKDFIAAFFEILSQEKSNDSNNALLAVSPFKYSKNSRYSPLLPVLPKPWVLCIDLLKAANSL